MKIEPGDLCITVPSGESTLGLRNSGRLVIAHKHIGHYSDKIPNAWQCECLGEPLLDGRGNVHPNPIISAKNLRPLRDGPGCDETLTWKEKEHA